MRLLLHQSRKDLRALRPLVGPLVMVLAARSVLLAFPFDAGLEGPLADERAAVNIWHMFIGFRVYLVLSMAYVALAVVTAVQLVQSDSPVTGTAFWVTRPISRLSMWTSKLFTAAAMLVALPVLADIAVLTANGIPLRDLVTAAWQGAIEQLALVVPPFALAALTADLAGFALASLGLLVGGTVASMFAFSFIGVNRAPRGTAGPEGFLAALIVAIVAALVISAVQFVTRDRRRSVLLVVLALLLFGVTAAVWPGTADTPVPVAAGFVSGPPLAAVPGATSRIDGRQLRVVRTSCQRDSCLVVVREARANFASDGRVPVSVAYDIVDAHTGSVLHGRPTLDVDAASFLATAGHLRVTWRRMRFSPPPGVVLDAGSLAAASLVPMLPRAAATGGTR
jgi:hypothetical protein